MKKTHYVIVGGGMTADSAVKGIREVDQVGSILMISSEKNPPYNRPPLSKALWKGKSIESIWRGNSQQNVEMRLNLTVTAINLDEKTVVDNQGQVYQYDKLLLATGGSPKKMPFGGGDVIYYRTLDDYEKLKRIAEPGKKIAVIGSGFIGSEIAAALATNDIDVSLFDTGAGVGWSIFPEKMVEFLNRYYASHNVNIFPNQKIVDIQKTGNVYIIRTAETKDYSFDVVVAGIGISPNIELADQAGLEINDGIVVDKYLRTSHPDVYAAGDVANFFNPLLKKRVRVEHADNANAMGGQAGRNIAGAQEPYDYLPLFYSDLFDLGYEAVGELNSRFQIVEDWQELFHKGVLYYLQGQHVKGVLLWNVWDKVDEARQVIGDASYVSEKDLVKRIV